MPRNSKNCDFGTPSLSPTKGTERHPQDKKPIGIKRRSKYVRFPAIGTKKHEKHNPKKPTPDAHKNQYTFCNYKNRFQKTKKYLLNLYGYGRGIKDLENPTGPVEK